MKNILFLAGLVLSVLLAFGLILVLNRIFRPLKQISWTSKNIVNGAYETRLPVSGHDELTEMSQSFNHMAEEIQRQMTELKDAADKKQQFVDNFAHELRTPLTAIYGYAEYMQKAVLSEDDRLSALNYIMSESRRLQTVAFQLLELANLQNNQITCEELKVYGLFEAVSQTLYGKLAEKNVQIEFNSEIETIRGDSCLMESMADKEVDSLICATDAGREGELIFRLVYEHCGCKKAVQRLWISSMEESAITEGLQNLKPDSEYDRLYDAALCRARADWLVGINATRLFSVLYRTTLNVGRVQTPTLAMIQLAMHYLIICT